MCAGRVACRARTGICELRCILRPAVHCSTARRISQCSIARNLPCTLFCVALVPTYSMPVSLRRSLPIDSMKNVFGHAHSPLCIWTKPSLQASVTTCAVRFFTLPDSAICADRSISLCLNASGSRGKRLLLRGVRTAPVASPVRRPGSGRAVPQVTHVVARIVLRCLLAMARLATSAVQWCSVRKLARGESIFARTARDNSMFCRTQQSVFITPVQGA